MFKNFIFKRGKQTVSCIFLFILAAVFLFFPIQTFAQDLGLDQAADIGLTPASETDIRVFIVKIVKYLLTFLGLIAVSMIMYSGFLWMTSDGAADKVEHAKKTLINSVVGLIITLSAFAIVSFVASLINDGMNSISGGPGSGSADVGRGYGAIGACTVDAVYPVPNQKDVPRNTSISVTFKEEVDIATIADAGFKIIPDNVHLYISNSGDGCLDDPSNCSRNVTDVNVSTVDNLTFVFTPMNYLGSPSEFIYYTIYFSNGITKLSDGSGIFDTCSRDYLEWEFQVSNKLDLIPPKVKDGGVFPPPDDEKDEITTVSAEKATGDFTILSQPTSYSPASFGPLVSVGTSPSASLSGQNFELKQSGTLSMAVNTTGNFVVLSNGSINLGQVELVGNVAVFPGFFTLNIDSNPEPGNEWTVTVIPSVSGDYITVGVVDYVFGDDIINGLSLDETAVNIASVLNSHPDISAVAALNKVNLTAAVAGTLGNNILLASSNSGAITFTPMSGGVPEGVSSIIADVKDKPRNAIIQINFNEAVSPLTISGNAQDVFDLTAIGVKCFDDEAMTSNCAAGPGLFSCGSETCVDGKFVVSNQYRTVEFIPDSLCGTNACGEDIYCLPGDTHIRVDLRASNLADCTTAEINCSTKSPYTTCSLDKSCENDDGVKYPLATTIANGVIDMVRNSLDGNRNGDTVGPLTYFDENNPFDGDGDNFQWSFYITDLIDSGAPSILTTGPANSENDADLTEPVTATFDELMMSSTLRTGSTEIFNGQDYYEHKLINIWNFTGTSLGYWVSKSDIDASPVDGEVDRTVVEISHSKFKEMTSYRTQIGSGVKDIYQNCYKPSSGPACVGAEAVDDANPSCCSGSKSSAEVCP